MATDPTDPNDPNDPNDPTPDTAPAPRSKVPIIVGIVVVVLAVGVGAFLYLTRDTSEPPLKLADSSSTTAADTDGPSGSTTGPDPAAGSDGLDGTWSVVAGSGENATVAGYRVQEVFAAGARRATAVGRTPDVTGSLTVADGTVTDVAITVDTTTLTSDQDRRDNVIKGRGLETDRFPEATFELTEPIELPDLPEGADVEVTAKGSLTLHGVTNEVEVPLTVRLEGDTVAVLGSVPVVMADYEIDPPNIGGFVEVDDSGTLEFIVNFQKS